MAQSMGWVVSKLLQAGMAGERRMRSENEAELGKT